jgi:O-antigen/teichoic acid export membrane protein
MSKKKKFFYGFFTDIGISGVKIMKMLLLIPLVINYTSSELYGIYLSMLSVVGLLGLIDLGSGIFIIKELAKDNSEKIKIKTFASVSNLIILNTMLILIVGVIIYPLVLNLSPEFEVISSIFLILLIIKIISNFSSIPTSIQISSQRMGFVNLIKILLVPLEILIVILFLDNDYGIFSLVYGELIISIIYLIIITISTKELFKLYRLKIYKSIFLKSLKYSFSYYLVKLSNIGLSNLDNILILYFLGAKYVTIYVITLKLPILFSREFSGKLSTNLFPGMSSLNIKNDIKKLRSVMLGLIKFTIRTSLLISIIIFLVNKSFIEVWVGLENFGGYGLNFIFSCILAVEFFYFALDPFILSHGNIKKFAKISLIELFVNVLISVVGVVYFGLIGIALGSLISKFSTSLLFMISETINVLKIKIQKVTPIFLNVLIRFGIGLPLYIAVFYFSKDINPYFFAILFISSALIINLLAYDFEIIFDRKLNIRQKIILIKNNLT